MNKLKFIKTYENFHEEDLIELKKYNKTYVGKKFKEDLIDTTEYTEILTKIRKYDVKKFKYVFSWCIIITPDDGFISLIKELNKHIEKEIDINIIFYITIDKNNLNFIDFKDGIPIGLRNLSLGYKLYKLVIENEKFITSDRYNSLDAKNIWYNLMKDTDLYCYTSNMYSGVIVKNDDTILRYFLDNLKNKEVIFDDELIEKINIFYGSLDLYKQRN